MELDLEIKACLFSCLALFICFELAFGLQVGQWVVMMSTTNLDPSRYSLNFSVTAHFSDRSSNFIDE